MGIQHFGWECHVWHMLKLRQLEASRGGTKGWERCASKGPSLDLIPWHRSRRATVGKDITLGMDGPYYLNLLKIDYLNLLKITMKDAEKYNVYYKIYDAWYYQLMSHLLSSFQFSHFVFKLWLQIHFIVVYYLIIMSHKSVLMLDLMHGSKIHNNELVLFCSS